MGLVVDLSDFSFDEIVEYLEDDGYIVKRQEEEIKDATSDDDFVQCMADYINRNHNSLGYLITPEDFKEKLGELVDMYFYQIRRGL